MRKLHGLITRHALDCELARQTERRHCGVTYRCRCQVWTAMDSVHHKIYMKVLSAAYG